MRFENFTFRSQGADGGTVSEEPDSESTALQNLEHLDLVVTLNRRTGEVILPEDIAPDEITAIYLGSDNQWRISTRPEMINEGQMWP